MNGTFFKSNTQIFIFSFILFSIGSFCISLFPPDEPRYFDAALRMIETGNYIVPFFNCHIRFDKPIFYYLELAAFFKMFFVEHLIKSGHDPLCIIEYASRLPSIITSSFTVLFTYLLSLKFFQNKKAANNSIFALLSFFFYVYLSKAVYPDASLIFFELAAVYFFIEKRYILAWVFIAFAFLTKGPIGIVTPGFTYFLYLWVIEKKSGLKEFFSLSNFLGFTAFLVISLPWYFAMYHYYGWEFINKFLIYHNIERFTGKAHQHPHSFFYYLPVIAVVSYMWIVYLKQLIKKIDTKDTKNIFLLLWFAWIVLFFSISSNKLDHYIAPAFIPLAVLFGRYLEDLKNLKKPMIGMFIFEILLGIGLSFYAFMQHLYLLIPTAFFGLFFVALMNFSSTAEKTISRKAIALHLITAVILMQFEIYRPEKRIWKAVSHNPTVQLYLYRVRNDSLTAYTRKCLSETKNTAELKNAEKPFYLYTRKKYLDSIDIGNKKILFYSKDKGKNTVFLLIK